MKTVPFNTGKVLIGSNYTPPVKREPLSRTESMLQSALLGSSATDWDGVVIIVVCAFLVAVPYLIMAWRTA